MKPITHVRVQGKFPTFYFELFTTFAGRSSVNLSPVNRLKYRNSELKLVGIYTYLTEFRCITNKNCFASVTNFIFIPPLIDRQRINNMKRMLRFKDAIIMLACCKYVRIKLRARLKSFHQLYCHCAKVFCLVRHKCLVTIRQI